MKSAGILFPLLVAFALTAAAQTSPPVDDRVAKSSSEDAKLSTGTAQLLTEKLPKFVPPPAVKPEPPKPNPDVIELPKMTITQKKRPRLNEEVMMTNKAFNEKLAKEKTGAFDHSFLNKSAFLGPYSAAARAREEYDYQKGVELRQEVLQMAKVSEVTDPAQAKVLRDAINKP